MGRKITINNKFRIALDEFGKRVSNLRKKKIGYSKKKLNQAQFAEKLGYEVRQISRLETGKMTPSEETVEKIAEILNTTTYFLYGETNDPSPEITEYQILLEQYIQYRRSVDEYRDLVDKTIERFSSILSHYGYKTSLLDFPDLLGKINN